MPLVDYESDSESDGETFEPDPLTPSAKSELSDAPPLPESFYSQYTTNPRLDHPDFHQGRSRVIDHKSGFFPSHVYIQWIPTNEELVVLNDLVASLQAANPSYKIESLVQSALGAPLPLHVSLSDTILLSKHSKPEFLQEISEFMASNAPLHGEAVFCVNGLPVMLSNADHSRIFLSLPLQKGGSYAWLQEFAAKINKKDVSQKYGYSPLPSGNLHVSVAWTLPVSQKEHGEKLEPIDIPAISGIIRQFRIVCDGIHLKVGNQVQVIKFK